MKIFQAFKTKDTYQKDEGEVSKSYSDLWIHLDKESVASRITLDRFEPNDNFYFYRFDTDLVYKCLRQAGSTESQGVCLKLPSPYTVFVAFKIWRSEYIPGTNVITYVGNAVADRETKIELTLTPDQLQATIHSATGSWYLSLIDKSDHLYLAHKILQ